MSEEKQEVEEKEEKQEVDFDSLAEKIEQSVSAKLDQSISTLEEKLKPKEKEEEDFDSFDESLTKDDVAKIAKAAAKEAGEEASKKFEAKNKKQQRDAQAVAEFPELQQGSKTFDKKFFNEVGKEIQARVKNGRNPEDVDLVYDAANAVSNRGQKQGWYVPKYKAEQTTTRRNANEDNFDVGGSSSKGEGVTEGQVKFASQMGMTPERFKQVVEKHMKK